MIQNIAIVDAFASQPFTGNPAAVCVMERFPDNRTMQQIAMEMNLSETAFLVSRAPLQYDLRWFSPTIEINLCGHATLAATHVLLEMGKIKTGDIVTYHTQSGELRARALKDGIELDFPELAGEKSSVHPALAALNVDITACELSRDNYLVEVKDFAALLACTPDFKTLAGIDAQGVIVTTARGVPSGFDFVSRYFGPNCGIDEDPVTGSAHCSLAPYWAEKLGKKNFRALQASKRQGVLDVTLAGERVLISGQAVTTLKGQIVLPTIAQEKAA